jgi:hypothetical protein
MDLTVGRVMVFSLYKAKSVNEEMTSPYHSLPKTTTMIYYQLNQQGYQQDGYLQSIF